MKRSTLPHLLWLVFLTAFPPLTSAQQQNNTPVWQDEFDGTLLDTAKWRHRAPGPRRDGVNVRDAVRLDGKGHLLFITSDEGGRYHTGMIGTQETFQTTYGYFECRVRLQRQPGYWSAFWLQSLKMNRGGDPDTSGAEIDIFEFLRIHPERIYHTIHWDGYGDRHKQAGVQPEIPGLDKGFHTFGLEWAPSEYIFYVDGNETWRTREAVSNSSEYMILSTEVGSWGGDIGRAALPDTFLVDYVRVYAHRPPGANRHTGSRQ